MKLCELCGMEIVKSRKYCTECSAIANGELHKVAKAELKTKRENAERMKFYHSDSLIEDIKKADELGISYGEYIASVRSGKNV